ncbi:general substrate transporter [Saitoella complicata NRRL Y-17804]|nr:general substrate transporter [Saitoella complicata NRRL Y-17804]ODQ53214.1 general substrate transporter [Saitoella complicata NRRL Y-17804]
MSGGVQRGTAFVGKPLVYFTTVFVSLGVFLFGYDQGVMSGIITGQYFNETFNYPSRAKLGTMVAILEVGAFISSIAVGRVGDLIGRRRTISYGACVFTMGGLIQTMSSGMVSMIIGRFTAGIGVGLLSTIVPIYQSEISPADHRGSLACIEFTGNIIGYASSVWIDYFASFIPSNMSWRLPLFMQCVMGFLLAVGSLAIVESPRWLLDRDHDIEGLTVLANLLAKGDTDSKVARDEFRSIKQGVLKQRIEGEMSYGEMWRRYKKRVLIAMSSQAFAQLNGINVISYYAPLVFEQAGWVGRDALLMTGINGLVYVASTIPPWYAIDYLGRRFILLSGAVVMCVALSSISCVMYLDKWYTADLVVALVIIYNASFGASWGPVPWLYPPEILPLTIRAKGASLSTATNWAFNFLVGEGTPVLQQAIKWKLYLIHAASCAVSFAVVWFFYPETKGVALEEMDVLFGDTVQDDEETTSLVRSGRSSMDVTPVRGTPETPSTPSRVGTPSDDLARGFVVKMKSGMQRMALSRQNSDYERLGNGDQQS